MAENSGGKRPGRGSPSKGRRTRGGKTKSRPAARLLSDINSLFIAGINHSSPAGNDPPGEYIGVIKDGRIPCRAVLSVMRSPSIRFFSAVSDVLLVLLTRRPAPCTGNWNRKLL